MILCYAFNVMRNKQTYKIETGREAVTDKKGAFHIANEIFLNTDTQEAQFHYLMLRNIPLAVKGYILTIWDIWNVKYNKK